MSKNANIAIILPISASYDRRVQEGVINYVRASSGIEIFCWPNMFPDHAETFAAIRTRLKERLSRFQIGGVLTNLWDLELRDWLQEHEIPVVDVGGTWPGSMAASVHTDNAAVGRLAARHLLDKGLKHFAYCGRPVPLHSCQRRDGFAAEIAEAGFSCLFFDQDISFVPSTVQEEKPLRQWLESLPKPIGMMCWYDYWAMSVEHVCRHAGIRIPDEIALIGVDNDELICRQCVVPLTSIDVCPLNIGFKAAELLHRMIRTRYRPREHMLLPPGNVIQRQSTDILAVDNPQMIEAMRFIQANADKPIMVRDILREVPLSRRYLEVQFQKLFSRSPRQQIQHAHVERAKMLLAKNDLGLMEISERCGFKTLPAFIHTFKRLTGCTPGRYRRQILRPEPVTPESTSPRRHRSR